MKTPMRTSPTRLAVLLAIAAGLALPAAAQTGPTEQPDKYTWLEDIHSDRSMAWVKAENARTAGVLEKDPRFATLEDEALKVLNSPERLPAPDFHGDEVYNMWQDAAHPRGIVRHASLSEYLKSQPGWQTVLDYDALAKSDNKSWVGKGLACLDPDDRLCMVQLSEGGEDAVIMREFDLKAGKFVDGGFMLPHSKQWIAWLDKDTLLISRDWGPGTMSDSGYPITIHEWKRGTPLESAKELFRSETKDVRANPVVFVDGQGHRAAIMERSPSFFEHEWFLLTPAGPRKLGLPGKFDGVGLLDGEVVIRINEPWTPAGTKARIPSGSVVSFPLDTALSDPDRLKVRIVFAPTEREFPQDSAVTQNRLLLTSLENVQGRAYVFAHSKDGKWTRTRLPIPDNRTVSIVTASGTNDRFFLAVEGFTTPPSLWLGDAQDGSFKEALTQKPLFDASNDVVEQRSATSKDGTAVPYFVVHRKDMKYDGNNPVLMTAYGGFQVSYTPFYDPVMGKLWLERGGVFVLANIRGGGEFGPEWHEAGLKTHRQRIYDDFYAVAQDLVERKITSHARLGIMGGSNGGLLMGVEFTQHPEMWGAVVIQVPLLDMLAYEHLSAGASWVGEYGSVSVPEERAFLASISPYNQLKAGVKYPRPLIFTTTRDDRVGPVHARKFAARMEEFGEPFFYDEITEGGHGEGADNRQEARTRAEMVTYLMIKVVD